MSKGLLLDTDVMIDFLRQRSEAVEYFDGFDSSPAISSVTVAELYAGVREGHERTALDDLIEWIEVIEVTREIARLGGLFRRDYFKSHGVGLADALIAATAESTYKSMVTLNHKHYPMMDVVVTPYIK